MTQMHLSNAQINGYYKNIDDYNPSRKRKIFRIFDDMIANIMTNKIPINN